MTTPGGERGASPPDPERRTEIDLIAAARGGSADAFGELVRRHMRRAYAVALRVTGQAQDAEDVVQDAFLAALVKLDTFDRTRFFEPWLLRIVVNRGINLRNAQAVRGTAPLPASAASREPSPFDAAEQSERRRELQRALLQLPERQRWIVELFDIDGFTSPEIADMLEISDGTVRWHLHQARHALRAALERQPVSTR